MTSKLGDIYKYNHKRYRFLGCSGKGLFEPKEYGFEPKTAE